MMPRSVVRKAVIPAAGVGTRLLPASKTVPKELLPIVDRPLIHLIAEECHQSGVLDLIIVTAPHKNALIDYFKRDRELDSFLKKTKKSYLLESTYRITDKLKIRQATQKEPKGLGDAVLCAKRQVGNDAFFAVVLPDDLIDTPSPCLKQMLAVHKKLRSSMVALMEVSPKDVGRYGIAAGRRSGDNLFELTDLVEKPAESEAPSRYAIVGRYILSRRIFQLLHSQKPGALGEYQLTDALRALLKYEKIYGYFFNGVRYDAGTPAGLLQANIAYAMKRPDFNFLPSRIRQAKD